MRTQIVVTVRDCPIFSSGLRQHLYFVISQLFQLGYDVSCLGQSSDIIHTAKQDFSELPIRHYILHSEWYTFLQMNVSSIAFVLGWELVVPQHISHSCHIHNIPITQWSCGNIYTPIHVHFLNNQKHLLHSYTHTQLVSVLPHHVNSTQLRKQIHPQNYITVPYVWSPTHIQCESIHHPYKTKIFRHIYVLEPNLNEIKHCFIPLLSIIQVYKQDPTLFTNITIHFLCSLHVKQSIHSVIQACCPNPEQLLQSVVMEGRFSIRDRIIHSQKEEPAIVISYQNQNELNNLYFDCLYSGIPIIHNSTMIGSCGYRYRDMDVHTTCSHLTSLMKGGVEYHLDTIQSQKDDICALMKQLDPKHPDTMSYMKYWSSMIASGRSSETKGWTNFGPLRNTEIQRDLVTSRARYGKEAPQNVCDMKSLLQPYEPNNDGWKPIPNTWKVRPIYSNKNAHSIQFANGLHYAELGFFKNYSSIRFDRPIDVSTKYPVHCIHPFARAVTKENFVNLWQGNHIFTYYWTLKENGYPIGLSDTFVPGSINIAPYIYVMKDKQGALTDYMKHSKDTEFIFCMAEIPTPVSTLPNVRYMQQNPTNLHPNGFYVSLFDRNTDVSHHTIKESVTLGFCGTYENLHPMFVSPEWNQFCKKENIRWIHSHLPGDWDRIHRDSDVLLSVRKNLDQSYTNKPASKLINSIRMGKPFICGPESAYIWEWEHTLGKSSSVQFIHSMEELQKTIVDIRDAYETYREEASKWSYVYSNQAMVSRMWSGLFGIPNIVHQTYSNLQLLTEPVRQNVNSIKETCKQYGWKYNLYDETRRSDIIRSNFDDTIWKAYSLIRPEYGPCRADLFRYCLMYLYGGVYIDIKSELNPKIFSSPVFCDPKKHIYLSHWSEQYKGVGETNPNFAPNGEICNWILISKPKQQFWLDLIRSIANEILAPKQTYVGKSGVLRLTGPICMTHFYHSYPNTSDIYVYPRIKDKTYCCFNTVNPYMKGITPHTNKKVFKNHYSALTIPVLHDNFTKRMIVFSKSKERYKC